MSDKKYLTDYPALMEEWDWEKNGAIGHDPAKIAHKSNKKVFWKCTLGHSWETEPYNRIDGEGCPYCSNRRLLVGFNDLKTTHPDLALEWDYEKNDTTPDQHVPGSAFKAFWLCKDCGHSWKTEIRHRTQRNTGCPPCARIARGKTRHEDSLQRNGGITNELLLKEWNYELNQLGPENYSPQGNNYAYWTCSKCGHVWKAKINNRHNGRGCPCCANKTTVPGVNDIVTTHPQLAAEWHPTLNGDLTPEQVTIGCGKKVQWLCPKGHTYPATVMHRGHGTNCPICCSGRSTSYAEQAIYYYIKKVFPDAQNRCTDLLGGRYELDIWIPSIKLGIEYDGIYWHGQEKSKKRESTKYDLCHQQGITLWRVREDSTNVDIKHPTMLSSSRVADSDVKADMIFYADSTGNNRNLDDIIYQLFYMLERHCALMYPQYTSRLRIPREAIDVKKHDAEIRALLTP
jgi:hypothetical protein